MTEIDLDPRPYYRRALHWAHQLISEVTPVQLGGRTPCPELDVAGLLGHLVATVHRARVIGEGAEPFSVPSVVTGVADDAWADAFAEAEDKLWTVWDDDARLDAELRAPWGVVSGRAALWGYVNETLVHGWDLAVATGRPVEADADLAEAALGPARDKIAADRRGGGIPFGPVVEPAPEAGPTERLANWSGHHR